MPVAAATVTSDYVKSTSLCTCGASSYSYHTATFQNLCPQCGHQGCLSYNPKGAQGGEWSCRRCGADYCAADGKEKIVGTHYWLKHYIKPKLVIANTATTPPVPTRLESVKQRIKEPIIGF